MHYKKLTILSLLAIYLLNNSACLKRVTVPLDTKEADKNDIYYVYLKPGMEYNGEWYLVLKSPRFENEYLLGIYRGQEIKIPLRHIKTIETIRQDKKKIIRGIIIGSLVVITVGIIGVLSPLDLAAED